MTVCIAAICENGLRMVTAADGAVTFGDICADVRGVKGQWLNDWQFLFSGELSEFDLIMEELRLMLLEKTDILSREKIQTALRKAYKIRFSKWSADRFLSPFDMEIKEFKDSGLKTFGDYHPELARWMEQGAANFDNRILLCGWGKSEYSAMIFEMCRTGAVSHTYSGFAAIGSGAQMAITQLSLLDQARHWSLEDTLYAVAAAKFTSEKSVGVGKETTIVVSRKRGPKDEAGKPPGIYLQPDEIALLRDLWEEYGRPKISPEISPKIQPLMHHLGAGISIGSMVRHLKHVMRSTSQKRG